MNSRRVLALAAGLLLSLTAASAVALPADAVDSVTVGGGELSATGSGTTSTVTVPIPLGMRATTLTGTVVFPEGHRGGALLRVGSTTVPVTATSREVNVPVPAEGVRDGVLPVELINDLDRGVLCLPSGAAPTVTLRDATVQLAGRETLPATVADFLTPSVRDVAVVVSPAASAAAQEAALNAVTSATRLLPSARVHLDVGQPRPASPAPGQRTVVIRDGGPAQAAVTHTSAGAVLTLSGPGAALRDAAAALGSAGMPLAGAGTVNDLRGGAAGAPATGGRTLAQLGTRRISLAGLGRLVASTTVSQSTFGGPTSQLTVHLTGRHTPVPTGGQAAVSMLWNDQLVGSVNLGADDRFDMTAVVAAHQLQRDNTLTVRADVIPAGGQCRPGALPLQLDIDGVTSTLTADRGQGLPPGFARFPQVFGTTVPVALADTPARTLPQAAELLTALQRLAATRLDVQLLTAADFLADSRAGVIVGASAAQMNELRAPLRLQPYRTLASGGTSFGVSVNAPFAALEAFTSGRRDVLALGTYTAHRPTDSAPLADMLLHRIRMDRNGWYGLYGQLLVAQPGQPVTAVDTAALIPQPAVVADGAHWHLPGWAWGAGATFVFVAAARLAASVRERRRLRRRLRDATRARHRADRPGDGTP